IYRCAQRREDWLTRGLPSILKISHSRLNEVREADLVSRGYQVLTKSDAAGVDTFVKQFQSRFIFFQGHPEYDALSLQREYMRDLARFLSGERNDYPAIPANYFDAATESLLADFETRARREREPTLAAELPGLALRSDIAAGAAANVLFRNWFGFLGRSPG
ncbi:MAG: homoserine O-acetyltransferase/O-succinyltransferase family protein, partial [Bradyrhizobium sp.]